MKIPSPDEAGVHRVFEGKAITAVGQNSSSKAKDSYCGARQLIPILALCFFGFGAGAQSVGDSSDAVIQGRQLAQKILGQIPSQNSTVTGHLNIRSDNGTRTSLPIACAVIASPTRWESIYEATWTNRTEMVWIQHGANAASLYYRKTNQTAVSPYELAMMEDPTRVQAPLLAAADVTTAFAGSDFCLADLGLEFFQWPAQKVLKQEIHRSRGCTVLESTNPHPTAAGYARVDSWIDTETLGIVEAYAYDAAGRRLKDFYPKDFKKVDGQWQVQTLVMENLQTGSRSRMEFDLKK